MNSQYHAVTSRYLIRNSPNNICKSANGAETSPDERITSPNDIWNSRDNSWKLDISSGEITLTVKVLFDA
ncbi:MAG: hypothetical protein KGZ58_11895 [Ignavibacteriales bacterium]|nr:hypothetical protein [Ignavibacteriales bacterium]